MIKSRFTGVFTAATVFVSAVLLAASAASGEGCFTIVVGKEASADGYVIMAHNEDDAPPQVVNHRKIPRRQRAPGEKVKLRGGGELDQVEVTWAYIWSEMPGMTFSDSYINEWGVCIASDACRSREDRPDITDGGIGYMLRQLVAQRARTAREGVVLAGELVEHFGYTASGRTYAVCDPDEAWLFCVVRGRHWLAQRVPDDEAAIIANAFTVRQVDLADSGHFMASDDIVEYAVSKGWYDPEEGEPFDFAAAYAAPRVASDSGNFCRQWSGLRHISGDAIPLGPELPFSVKPKQKLDVAALIRILRDHYEGTEFYAQSSPTRCPHESRPRTICCGNTQTSFVVQLRRSLPLDIGIVYWVCLASPCMSFYIPFHFGISEFPSAFFSDSTRPSNEYYQERIEGPFRADAPQAFWTFSNFRHKIGSDYGKLIDAVRAEAEQLEKHALALQRPLEEAARQLYPVDKPMALKMLVDHSDGLYLSALEAMERVLSRK